MNKEYPDHFSVWPGIYMQYTNEDLIALSLWTVDGKSDDDSF